jgi:hypothetical protein
MGINLALWVIFCKPQVKIKKALFREHSFLQGGRSLQVDGLFLNVQSIVDALKPYCIPLKFFDDIENKEINGDRYRE